VIELLLKLTNVQRYQMRIRLRKPNQVQLVLLALAETPPGIAIGPELALGDVFQASDSHMNPQNHGLDGSIQEFLVSRVRCELYPQVASGRLSIY
jgi:hypothetical protein